MRFTRMYFNFLQILTFNKVQVLFSLRIMSHNRYYSKKDYKGDYSAFGTGVVFLFVGILSLVFRRYNIEFIGLGSWGYWLFIPAFFTIIGAIRHLDSDRRMRNNILFAVQNRGDSTVKLETLAEETGIKPKNVLRVLVDLRNSGKIKYRYDTESGEIMLGEMVKYEKAPEFTEPISQKQLDVIYPSGEVNFCPYCGHKASAGMQYCESCGSKLS